MQHKRLSKLTTQRSHPKRYELISLSIGWLIAFFISFIDYSLNCYVFRFLTAYYIPLSFCCLIDMGIMIVGIANAGFCVLALFDFDIFSKIGHPFSLSRLLRTLPTHHPKESHTLSRAVDVHLEGSFIDQSPKNVSSTLVDNLLNRRKPGTDITRRSSTPLLHDIYTDEQLDTLSGIRLNSFAHKTFEPKVNQSFKYKYYTSEEQNEEEKRDLSQLDQSQLDLLNKSEHFEKNPQEHPLEAPKRKHASAGTTKGNQSFLFIITKLIVFRQ
uniref:Uncharacterized protein n=1 Tax=Panagrolaimus davidi TaxID=227884 RepID=A0A914PQW1_9BILA